MDFFNYRDGALHAEDCNITELAATYGTPLYVYSEATLERHFQAYAQALQDMPHLVCYAVKANPNLAILRLLARLGAGFDIVSRGELERVLTAGGDPARVVFSGVGKQTHEICRALEVGIKCFNVESLPELERINNLAGRLGVQAPVSLRINPDVDPGTHPYISTGLKENKFGIPADQALVAYRRAKSLNNLQVIGLDCHIGSQITELAPFLDALDRLLLLIAQLKEEAIEIHHLDLGGGLGVRYRDEEPPLPATYVDALRQRLQGFEGELILEPGRAIVANAGILVTRVEYLKQGEEKHFAIVDAAMNDLLRPSLYGAWQEILPVVPRTDATPVTWDVVGPVCETGDFLGKDRPLALQPGDLLAVRSAGAYGFSMASNYNSRNRCAEVLVRGERHWLVRQRETYEQQMANEMIPDIQ